MAIFLAASNSTVFAEEVEAVETEVVVASPETIIKETITHLENALVAVDKGDFSSSNLHIKAARISANKITNHEEITKKASTITIQAQMQSRKGNSEQASVLLTEALALFKSL